MIKCSIRDWEAVERPEYLSCIGVKLLPQIIGDVYLLLFKKAVDFHDKTLEKNVEADSGKGLSPFLVNLHKRKGKLLWHMPSFARGQNYSGQAVPLGATCTLQQ